MEREQLGDQRNDGESNFNSGDGTGQMAQPWMFMMMMIFTKRFDYFVPFVKPSADDPVLLIVDGHYSNTKKYRCGG
jgi:hypothetical protein